MRPSLPSQPKSVAVYWWGQVSLPSQNQWLYTDKAKSPFPAKISACILMRLRLAKPLGPTDLLGDLRAECMAWVRCSIPPDFSFLKCPAVWTTMNGFLCRGRQQVMRNPWSPWACCRLSPRLPRCWTLSCHPQSCLKVRRRHSGISIKCQKARRGTTMKDHQASLLQGCNYCVRYLMTKARESETLVL